MQDYAKTFVLACGLCIIHTLKPHDCHGQGYGLTDTLSAKAVGYAELGALASTAARTPFWLRANQYGTVPLGGPAGLLRLGGHLRLGDWQNPNNVHLQVAAEGVANLGNNTKLLLPVANITARYRFAELYLGRRREVFGLADTLLSSGSYAWSGNALPIPKIQLGTPGFVPLRFTRNAVAINALYAHGWFANTDSIQNSFLHQKALFLRFGKPESRLQFMMGVTHYAQWGGYSATLGKTLAPTGHLPSSLKDYLYVITARQYPDDGTGAYSQFDLMNRLGNHLGSMDIAINWTGKASNLFVYIQHPYEDKSGVAMRNLPDGLYGIRWRNNRSSAPAKPRLLQVTAEFLTTLNQGGFNTKNGSRLYDGADDYFVNYQYRDGWTHKKRVIGTPFITQWNDTRPELYDMKGGYGKTMISNNRIQVIHIALFGEINKTLLINSGFSGGKNFGRPIVSNPRLPVHQFSAYIHITKKLKTGALQANIAWDKGKLLPSNLGGEMRYIHFIY